MNCIASSSYSILINGQPTQFFYPSRQIHQGDPNLSLLIHSLCMEYLSGLIKHAVSMQKWTPIYLSKNGPSLSHLFFADDILLYAQYNDTTFHSIISILSYFYNISG